MSAAVHREVLEQLEMLIVAGREDGGIPERAELAVGRDLWESHVARIRGHAKQTDLLREGVAAVRTDLAAADRHPAESQLVQHSGSEDARVAQDDVSRP